jgi:inosine-uridine nucleoside N-ribohydrolase
MAEKTKILIDCDPGHDDAVAILFAARHLDLVGVTTVHGNNALENTTRNALAVLELAGIDVPLAKGCAEPLVQKSIGISPVHGEGGLEGVELAAPTRKPVATHAVDFIVETASRHRGELVLAAIGPQTNIALALAREPLLKEWVREITVMGGSTTQGNITPAAEFNIFCDPEAASAVFESGIAIRMVGLNVTRRTGFEEGDIDRMRYSKKPVAAVVADLMGFYLDKQKAGFGLKVAPMHDVCAIVPHVDPSLIDYVHTSVRVELCGTYSRGMTVCDLRRPAGSAAPKLANRTPPNALIAVEARERQLIHLVIETILSY